LFILHRLWDKANGYPALTGRPAANCQPAVAPTGGRVAAGQAGALPVRHLDGVRCHRLSAWPAAGRRRFPARARLCGGQVRIRWRRDRGGVHVGPPAADTAQWGAGLLPNRPLQRRPGAEDLHGLRGRERQRIPGRK